jgi:SAM-dependent methyltransferase
MAHPPAHAGLAPAPWITRFGAALPPGAAVLDVACGSGRHLRWFAERGCRVTGVDRDAAALEPLRGLGETVVADIEAGPWPFDGRRFDAVVVTNYLWRPLLPAVVAAVAEGGWLLVETFAVGNETVGKPSNPAFLLRPGELLEAAAALRTVAYEDGFLAAPARFVQRIAAVREIPVGDAPRRHVL